MSVHGAIDRRVTFLLSSKPSFGMEMSRVGGSDQDFWTAECHV